MTVMLTHVCEAQRISGARDFNGIQIGVLWFKRNGALVYSDTAKFSISASLHFHLMLIQACSWDLTRNGCLMCPGGSRRRTRGFTKDLCFCCTVCRILKKKDISYQEMSFLNESCFVLKICPFPLPFCLSQSGSSRLELTKRLMVQRIYRDPFVFLHGEFSRGAWTTANILSKIRLCCWSSAKWKTIPHAK